MEQRGSSEVGGTEAAKPNLAFLRAPHRILGAKKVGPTTTSRHVRQEKGGRWAPTLWPWQVGVRGPHHVADTADSTGGPPPPSQPGGPPSLPGPTTTVGSYRGRLYTIDSVFSSSIASQMLIIGQLGID